MMTDPAVNMMSASASGSIPAIGESQSSSSPSSGVAVGLLSSKVSEMIPAIIMPAMFASGVSL